MLIFVSISSARIKDSYFFIVLLVCVLLYEIHVFLEKIVSEILSHADSFLLVVASSFDQMCETAEFTKSFFSNDPYSTGERKDCCQFNASPSAGK